MDIRHLKYFLGVADAGSFVAAAKALGLSQPALSARIKEVESWAGKPLFRRLPRGVALTDQGARLVPYAREVIDAMARAEDFVAAAAGNTISIGVTPTPGVSLVPELLALAGDSRPALSIFVQQGSSDELLDMLRRSRIDAALCYRVVNSENLVTVPLFTDDLVLVGSRRVMEAAADDIPFEQIVRLPLLVDPRSHATRRELEEEAFRRGLSFERILEVEPVITKRVLIETQGYYAIVPRALFAEDIRSGNMLCRRIVEPTLTLSMGLIMHSSMKQRLFEQLRTLMQTVVRSKMDNSELGWRPVM